MEHIAPFANEWFGVIIHDNHSWALAAVPPPLGTGQHGGHRFAASVKEGLGTGGGHRQATIAKTWAEQVFIGCVVDVLHATFPVDHKHGSGHDAACYLMVDVEQDHLFVLPLLSTQLVPGCIPLFGCQRCVNIVVQTQRSE